MFCNLCRGGVTQAAKSSSTSLRKYTIPPQLRAKNGNFQIERKTKEAQKNTHENKVPIISCRRPEFNFHKDQVYSKFSSVPLVSKGWQHNKSKGDYFVVHHYGDPENKNAEKSNTEKITFEQSNLDNKLIENLRNLNLVYPTKIQELGIPTILSGKNTLLAAETGCGKTLAYLLPIIHKILRWKGLIDRKDFNRPLALVLSPSRELAHQIGDVAKKITHHLNIHTRVIIGGRTKQKMLNPTIENVDLIIATLGAISKLTTAGIYEMSAVRHIVLDEADSLLDDSFNEKLQYFMRKFHFSYSGPETDDEFPKAAQITLASATMPTSIPQALNEIIAPESLVHITTDELHRILPHVPQKFLRLSRTMKPAELLKIVKTNAAKKHPTIVFSNKTTTCDWVSMTLNETGVKCVNLNGDMPIAIRLGKFAEFQRGEVDVLSSTDAGSRGLDTVRVRHVINYDFPLYTADYIHRCGRTGRVGSHENCQVTNFIASPREVELVQKIEMATRKMAALPNVNANIRKIINDRIMKEIEELEAEKESREIPF